MITKILMNGCNGRMGQVISASLAKDTNTSAQIIAGVDINLQFNNPFHYPVYRTIEECSESFDVIIDFSSPAAFTSLYHFLKNKPTPVVIATTGLTDDQKCLYIDLSKKCPVFVSANMSLGINTLIALATKAASILNGHFDIEILDAHHNNKVDAPSGTALMIADEINHSMDNQYRFTFDRHSIREPRNKDEIGIHSIRGGSIVGDHTVFFAGNEEVLEITHRAQSRNVFAEGAIAAANFLASKAPGLYSMKDLIGQ